MKTLRKSEEKGGMSKEKIDKERCKYLRKSEEKEGETCGTERQK